MNPYLPQQLKIISIKDLAPSIRLFRLKNHGIRFNAGQFVIAGIFGFGEAPISISSSPTNKDYLELTIKSVGKLTQEMNKLKSGDTLGVRGPYGNGFPISKLKGKKLVTISGGCGLAPIRSIIGFANSNPKYFEHIQILTGAKDPASLLYQDELRNWKRFAEVIITVDKPDSAWSGNTGSILSLINTKTIHTENSAVIVCGPPVIYSPISEKLLEMGISGNDIYFSLERKMQCGIGLCQHCTCGDKYVCTDGPVFSLSELGKMEYKGD